MDYSLHSALFAVPQGHPASKSPQGRSELLHLLVLLPLLEPEEPEEELSFSGCP